MNINQVAATSWDSAQVWAHLFGCKTKERGLHPWQIALCDHPAKEKYACWGRRAGKSIVLGEVLIPRKALRYPERQQWIFSRTHKQAKIIFEYLVSTITNSPLELSVDKILWSSPFECHFKNGSRVYASSAGYDGGNSRGFFADDLYLDEVAFMKRRAVEDALLPSLAASKDPTITGISTPNGLEWFHEQWLRGQPGNDQVKSWRMPSWYNPFINVAFLQAEHLRKSRLAWDVEYGARFVDDQGHQFPWSVISPCLDESIHLEAPAIPGHRYTSGWDPAEMQDRSGLVTLDATDLPYLTVDVRDIAGHGYIAQHEYIQRHTKTTYPGAQLLMDITGHRSDFEQLTALGINPEAFVFTNESKRELLDNLRVVLEHKDVRIPADAFDLISELKFYRREQSKAGNVVLGAPENGYDDFTTALALAAWQAKTQILPYGWIRNDPSVRGPVRPEEAKMTDAERVAKRIADYHAAQGGST